MINTSNLRAALVEMGFLPKGQRMEKSVNGHKMAVDFKKQVLEYAAGVTINELQATNFAQNENFVVFECVHRLLSLGYKPEHIEIEPSWRVGHGKSGGRADILVHDHNGKPLLIIECKTPDSAAVKGEFSKAWDDTKRDGGQLFGYAQQISSTDWLCLYTSYLNDENVLTYQSYVIAHRDNNDYLLANPKLNGFAGASDITERFAVWRDTYKCGFTTQGIFEPNVQPYRIGKDKYTLGDLHSIAEKEQRQKYHEFATILRQHNISGRENAFDKLVNLFLCKLVDETQNPQDLKSYWKGVAYDTHFELLDRLQLLYQAGMKEFLGEEITYIDRDAVVNAMRFIRDEPDETQKSVWELFQQQKFFTNNDFSLIDVHNERLFYQNAEVLLKILQMWQDIRMTGDQRQNQFLGDLFEGFLDQGVKQSEGQYFTPTPICRFITMSLPLKSKIATAASPLRAIDYACGAGHFLTEYATQIKQMLPDSESANEWNKNVYGVEKEYRLSKVAKVSAFMNGQKDINIVYGDALVREHAAFPDLRDDSFDVLIANPPYSVQGFLDTLPKDDRASYTMTDAISDPAASSSIEAFFVERAEQLLVGGGVAAIILPAAILSTGNAVYGRAREVLLQHFDIVAIASFGSGTFGKTNTNTVTLFLRRKFTDPDVADHFRSRVDAWFGKDGNQAVYNDAHIIDAYVRRIGVARPDYESLLRGKPSEALLASKLFQEYRVEFDQSAFVVGLRKRKIFGALNGAKQAAELNKYFIRSVQKGEREKLYYFALASDQDNLVLLVRSPTKTDQIKKFLGYEWSAAKGNEGIKLYKDAGGHLKTALYDETDRSNPNKISTLISANFEGTLGELPEELKEFTSTTSLVDLIDFSSVLFDKKIATAVLAPTVASKRWPMVQLSEVASFNPSKSEIRDLPDDTLVSFVEMSSVAEQGAITQQVDRPLREVRKGSFTYFAEGDIIIAKITPSMENGKAALARNLRNGIALGSSEFNVIRPDVTKVIPEFLFEFLNRDSIRRAAERTMTGSSGHRRVPQSFYERLDLPDMDFDEQRAAVSALGAISLAAEEAASRLNQAEEEIVLQSDRLFLRKTPRVRLADLLAGKPQYGTAQKPNSANRGYKVFRASQDEVLRGRMVDTGVLKSVELAPGEFAKYRVNRGDLFFIRSSGSTEHIGRVGLFDRGDGEYCFAGYLVRFVPNQAVVDPAYLAAVMNAPRFREELLPLTSQSGGTRNLNATAMTSLMIPFPADSKVRREYVATIAGLTRIADQARLTLESVPSHKQEVLDRYL